MRIAILGTRGIPNNYGGFEQLAQYLSIGLLNKGHEVFVYSSSRHPYKQRSWNGIHIIHKYDPEKEVGTVGQFIYDLNCIVDSRRRKFDSILNLGYTSSSVWMKFFDKKTRVITNMDGLEWKRTKYSDKVKKFLMYAEKLAVKGSTHLVSDSLAIKKYLYDKYQAESTFIAYGANLFKEADFGVLNQYKIEEYKYNLLIARMEPENNIEMILDGVAKSKIDFPFLVIGNHKNKFGTYLKSKFEGNKKIIFTGSIYDELIINNLRYYSNLYFHGHSVGGTNPSLLEAMGCSSLIAAHKNEFNESVLESDAFYFTNDDEVKSILDSKTKLSNEAKSMVLKNYSKIESSYSWDKIVQQYEEILVKP